MVTKDIHRVHKKKYHFCILAITTSNLHQIQKGRSVLKSARSEDFKTDLTFDIWPSRSLKKLKTEKNVKTENDPLQGSELGLL